MGQFVETVNTALSQMGIAAGSRALVSGEKLAPGIWFDMDAKMADHTASIAKPAQGLVAVSLKVRQPGRWFTLNIDLGDDDLAQLRLIGFALRSQARKTLLSRVCIRNFIADGFEDVFFPLDLVSFGDESSHADVLWLADHPVLQRPAKWRTLIVFLDPEGVEITLADMRLFVA